MRPGAAGPPPAWALTMVSTGRPTIGIALGGGAARGWAHIGVLKSLIAAGLEPDIVAGTSIGAVAGACYVTGRLDALEDFACGLTRRRIFGFLDFNFAGSGLITGQRLSARLEQHLAAIRHRAARAEIRRGRHRARHRARGLAQQRQPGERAESVVRAARHLPPRADQRPLADRRRAGQSDSGLGLPRARRPHRHRRQSEQRRVQQGRRDPRSGSLCRARRRRVRRSTSCSAPTAARRCICCIGRSSAGATRPACRR